MTIPRAAALALIEAIDPLEGLGAGGFFRHGLFCAMGALGYRGLVRHGLMEEDEGILTDRGTVGGSIKILRRQGLVGSLNKNGHSGASVWVATGRKD